ncbi:protein SMAX1-like [Musa acuminata AAA Group]|uniref:protein SMAX1-like n=1 Tax=Musa acuminata AAA Group TaxID=214697 RepID=UPI0031E1751F
MRTEVATMQQMLTPEAAAVLVRSIEEADRRRHGQTTPLHVAANLLAAPSGLLRRACTVSHPLLASSSHPLHCRALDLCFSVALDRLPASATGSDAEQPPLSNALVAAVKRAQAHQRRGCLDQQQPPLLAIRVELGHLVVSILDDPSVSRVMREAGFSSPAVKTAIEQSLSSNSATVANSPSHPVTRNVYLSPLLQQQERGGQDASKREDVMKVLEIMTRPKKRNPVLVGDSDAASVMEEVLLTIEKEQLGIDTPASLRSAQVVSLEKEFMFLERSLIPVKINELYGFLEPKIRDCSISGGVGGLILDLGDLKWLVENPGGHGASPVQQQQQTGRAVVTEMGRLLARLREDDGAGSRVWVVGTATCATYLRCQVYHPTMEVDWDLQALPIAPRSPPLAGLFPRPGGNSGSLSNSATVVAQPKLSPASGAAAIGLSRALENTKCWQPIALCHLCMQGYQLELAKTVSEESESHSSEPREDTKGTLPRWLQNAVPSRKPASDHLQRNEQELLQKQKVEELLGKWRGRCTRLHLTRSPRPQQFLEPRLLAVSGTISPTQGSSDHSLKLNSVEHQTSPPVKTDLVLGLSQPLDTPSQKPRSECIEDSSRQRNTITGVSDVVALQRLRSGLTEAVSWQPEAASAIATAVTRRASGNRGLRSAGAKAGSWLLFTGPDKVGKWKMASALSELVFNTAPIRIHLGDDGESDVSFRGKTSLDRVAEAIQQNPFSLIVLEDVDHANTLVRRAIKRAIETGWLVDSRRQEVGLGSIIFILISDWWPDDLRNSENCHRAKSSWQLEHSLGEKSRKHGADWTSKNDQPMKQRKQSYLSLDLNLAVSRDEDDNDAEEGSWNSSDLTMEHDRKFGQLAVDPPTSSYASELIDLLSEAIVFKPVDLSTIRKTVSDSISSRFMRTMGNLQPLEIDEDALDRIAGGVWQSGATNVFDEWFDRVLVPSINRMRSNSDVSDRTIIRLTSVKGGCAGNSLPSSVSIAIDGA